LLKDYCNNLQAGCTKKALDKLQRVLNCSARVIFGGDSRHHVSPLFGDNLHWLNLVQTLLSGAQGNPRPGTTLSQHTVHPSATVPDLSVLRFAAVAMFVPRTS